MLQKAIGFGALGVGIGLSLTVLGSIGDRATMAQPTPSPAVTVPNQAPSQTNSAYVPLSDAAITAMLQLVGVTREDVVYSLGAGDGRLAIAAAKNYGAKRSVIVEANPALLQLSTTNAQQAGVGDRTQFLQQEPLQADLREASVVNLEALPNVPARLRSKFLAELKPGTRLIARTAALGDWKPDQTVAAAGTTLYYWVVPERIAGDWQGQVEFAPGRSQSYTLRFTQQFQQVKGDAIAAGKKYNIPNITLTGDRLTFSRAEAIQGQQGSIQFNGRIDGDTLKGTAGIKWGVLARNFPILAKRSGQASN